MVNSFVLLIAVVSPLTCSLEFSFILQTDLSNQK